MKVKLIRPSVRTNPDFDKSKPNKRGTNNFHLIDLPIGTEIEADDAYFLCLSTPQMAVPIDNAAIEKVKSINPDRVKGPNDKVKIVIPMADGQKPDDKKTDEPE